MKLLIFLVGPLLAGVSSPGLKSVSTTNPPITGAGTVASPLALDASSVTLQGNTFNGASQLLQCDASGLVPNADLDSSSVTLLGPSIDLSGAEVTGSLPAASVAAGIFVEGVITSSLAATTTLSNDTTGNSGTATALAANGANCSAGSFPLGMDASGAAESCTAVSGVLVDTAAVANALASNPAACSAGDYVTDMDADGTLTCDTPASGGVQASDVVTWTSSHTFTDPDFSVGTSTLVITNGQVGIGTTAPSTQGANLMLHVCGKGECGTVPALDSEVVALFQNNSTNNEDAEITIIAENSGVARINFGDQDQEDVASIGFDNNTGALTIDGWANICSFSVGTVQCNMDYKDINFIFWDDVSAKILFDIDNGLQSMSLGGSTFDSSGRHNFVITEGTAPASAVSNSVVLYATGTFGATTNDTELWVIDSAGNRTQLSPHKFEKFSPTTGEQYVAGTGHSCNDFIGRCVEIDWYTLAKEIEKISGKKIVHEWDVPALDWDADQEAKRLQREEQRSEQAVKIAECEQENERARSKGDPERECEAPLEPFVKRGPPEKFKGFLKVPSQLQ